MQHADPDVLALLALGEGAGSAAERAHVEGCAACTAELDLFVAAIAAGSRTDGSDAVPMPHPRVWARVQQELGGSAASPGPAPSRRRAGQPDTAPRPPRRRRALVVALAMAALIVVTGASLAIAQRLRAPAVIASATLDPFAAWPQAAGRATVERDQDGTRVVRVSVNVAPTTTRSDQVWLMTKDGRALVSLGVLPGESGSFRVPDGIDLDRYDVVDVSAEPHDGNPKHSGDSIVRGPLDP